MSEPEFRLLPWERGGHPIAPSQEISARVEGRLRRFWVKAHDGGVYFSLADEDDERVWTLLERAPASAGELEAVFRTGVEANRAARLLLVQRSFSTRTVTDEFATELNARFHPSNLHMMGPTTFVVAVDGGGRALAQEWCGGPRVEFALPSRSFQSGARRPSIWHRGWNAAGLSRKMAPLAGHFAFRTFAPPEDVETWGFVRGSETELQKLFHAAHVHFIPRYLAAPKAGANWYLSMLSNSRATTLSMIATVVAETRANEASLDPYMPIVPRQLLDLFLAHNLPVGGEWKHFDRTDYSLYWNEDEDSEDEDEEPKPPQDERPSLELNKRVDFEFRPHQVQLRAEVPREPSAHERMEAFVTLREWLEEKGYGSQVRSLLEM